MTMQTSASPFTFLATSAPGGKPAAQPAGPHVHKAAGLVAEASLNNTQEDEVDVPAQASHFSQMLRDETAHSRPNEARIETKTTRKGDAGARTPRTSSAEHEEAIEASTELSVLLASLMQGQGPLQAAGEAKPGRSSAAMNATEKQEAASIASPEHARGRTPKRAAPPLDNTSAVGGSLTKPGPNLANREALLAGAAAARTALGGAGAGSATNPAASEASQQLRSALQRVTPSDAASSVGNGSTTTSAHNGALGQPINILLPSTASAFSAASTAVDTALPQDVRRPEFVPAFSARIATLVQEGVEHARVHLNPLEMGPVSLQLSLDGQQVRVDMTAELAATRLVLEQALPTLAGALREAGFTLSGGGVSQPVTEAANLGGQEPRNAGGSAGEPPPQTSGSSTGPAGQQADGRRAPEGDAGPNHGSRTITATEGLATELHLNADGRPQLTQGRGLVDTFA